MSWSDDVKTSSLATGVLEENMMNEHNLRLRSNFATECLLLKLGRNSVVRQGLGFKELGSCRPDL